MPEMDLVLVLELCQELVTTRLSGCVTRVLLKFSGTDFIEMTL